ncbi:hypothetical protein CHS0354_027429 [Potamilus streckersoni]|uniref:Uncharacterized protein n=1 Tax=Potamilus streckersoni TaxID=2493646 RepID=A0AAE0S2X9_9BIVA|nr:hypothetical protein CHS0354_027429 [Potamilus streckersoni]
MEKKNSSRLKKLSSTKGILFRKVKGTTLRALSERESEEVLETTKRYMRDTSAKDCSRKLRSALKIVMCAKEKRRLKKSKEAAPSNSST